MTGGNRKEKRINSTYIRRRWEKNRLQDPVNVFAVSGKRSIRKEKAASTNHPSNCDNSTYTYIAEFASGCYSSYIWTQQKLLLHKAIK